MVEDMSDYGHGIGEFCQPGVEESEERDTLVGAIHSLEKTIAGHCHLLNRKNRKDNPGSIKGSIKVPRTDSPSALARPPSSNNVRNMVTTAPPVGGPKGAVRGDKVTVYIRVVFLKIGEIDTLKENFAADAFIQARWREPQLDGQQDMDLDDIEWNKFWNPKIYVENNLGEPKETVWQTMMFNAKGDATVYERRRIKGCFLENLELDEFPFDTQDLTLTVTSERSECELELEEDHSEISSINVQSFVDEQEWKLHSHVETWKRVTTRIYHNSKFKHPAISTSCRASRRPGFFIWNIFLVMLFICSLAFTTFTVDFRKPENRLQLSFILLLTTITFKFVVSQTLPRISYLTYLDKYILTSMGILCGVCMWHSIVPLMENNMPLALTADRCALIVLGSGYFMFHVVFFLYIYFVALKKRWKYNEKDREHKERIKKLQKLNEEETQKAQTRPMEPI